MGVTRRETNDYPLFVGPILLHGNSSYKTHRTFYNEIAVALFDKTGDVGKLVIGTDDDKAARLAIKKSIPEATQVLCTRHLKKNTDQYMSEKVGLEKNLRQIILKKLFSENGLTSSEDETTFEIRVEEIKEYVEKKAPSFGEYLSNITIPRIRDFVFKPAKSGCIPYNWTSNNVESINHVLKMAVDWKPQALVDLVSKLYDVVRDQYQDVKRALIGRGNFKLSPSFAHHRIDKAVWLSKTPSERESLFQKFLKVVVKNLGKEQENVATEQQMYPQLNALN